MSERALRTLAIPLRGLRSLRDGGTLDDGPESSVSRGPVDVLLIAAVAALLCLGMIAVYTGSAMGAYFSDAADDLFYLSRQAVGVGLGLIALIIGARVDYDIYRRHVYKILGVSLLLLLVIFLVPSVAHTVNGSTRWIRFPGFTFQPSELVKLSAVIYLAYSVAKKDEAMKRLLESFVWHFAVFLPFILLLMEHPDLGSSVVISLMAIVMLFVGGARLGYLVGAGMLGLVGVIHLISKRTYRMERVTAWLDPWADPSDSGFQLINAMVAFANGGLTGTGFGEGRSRLGFVPELFNDFAAASIGEELGLVGMALICTLYVVFIWRGMVIAFRARDAFGAFLAFGITTLIGMQAAINLCVVTGALPTKGLTLPFVSYGRSSLIISMFAVGILTNIAQRNPNLYLEREDAKDREQHENTLLEMQLRVRERQRRLSAELDAVPHDVDESGER